MVLKVVSGSSGGGSGTVTSITAGTGINVSPSPITTTGIVALANTAVTAGSYGNASTVAKGEQEDDELIRKHSGPLHPPPPLQIIELFNR